MKGTHKIGRQGGRGASVKHGLVAALVVMFLAHGGVLAGTRRIVGPTASDVSRVMRYNVYGLIEAGAGFVNNLHQFYQITQLRKVRVEGNMTPTPAQPSKDKSRS